MLDKTNLKRKINKKDYRKIAAPLKERLSVLQHEVKNSKLPVIIIFEGWDASGKGRVLSDVILTLDPRNFKTKSMLPPTAQDKRKPFLWRHWNSIPEAGLFSIYDYSWYPEVSYDRLESGIDDKTAYSRMDSINMFERQLADDGTLIIKIFLHINKKEQKERLDELSNKKSTAWQVNKNDYVRNKSYDEYYKIFNEMLEYTNKDYSRWNIVSSMDEYCVLADVYTIIVSSIENALKSKKDAELKALKNKEKKKLKDLPYDGGEFKFVKMPLLNEIKLDKSLERSEYKERLAAGQKKLKKLHNYIYLNKIPVIIGYEGWDAAGKGGNIKRLTEALDPRGYEVIPISSPTPPEKNRQFLWRFWSSLPKDGHFAIYDRTWYGRVLVERVEGFANTHEWKRAYREINEFEAELNSWGAIIIKFWLQIDKDEQLRRFEARQNTVEKQWKITDEDWRNRDKWDNYELAVNDMLSLTSTCFAPWAVIESQDKYYARVKAIETVIKTIEKRL